MNQHRLAVCLPGGPFEPEWVMGWSLLFVHLLNNGFQVKISMGQSNNIFIARQMCLDEAFRAFDAEYLLWIDSDNPPTPMNFEKLWSAIQASEKVSVIAGWYRLKDGRLSYGWETKGTPRGLSTAGPEDEDRLRVLQIPISVDFAGFGLCLMRSQVIQDIGMKACFRPVITQDGWLTDDDGFGFRARNADHRIFVHPQVFCEHQKMMFVQSACTSEEQGAAA